MYRTSLLVDLNRSFIRLNSNDFSNQVGDVSDQTDEKRVQVQRIENALNNGNKVAQSYDQLEINIHISNSDVDLLYGDLNTSIDLDKTGNLSIKVEVCLKPLNT